MSRRRARGRSRCHRRPRAPTRLPVLRGTSTWAAPFGGGAVLEVQGGPCLRARPAPGPLTGAARVGGAAVLEVEGGRCLGPGPAPVPLQAASGLVPLSVT